MSFRSWHKLAAAGLMHAFFFQNFSVHVFSVHELLLTRASRRMADRIKYGSLEAQAGERVPAIA
jgi:hypothetical protein